MSDGPRVLLVSAEYPPIPGGIGDYTALLATHLGAQGASVAVLTGGTNDVRRENDVMVFRTVPQWRWGLPNRVMFAAARTGAEIIHVQYQTGMYGMHPAINILPLDLRWYPPVRRLVRRADRRSPRHTFRTVTTFHDLLPPYLFPKAGPLRAGVTRLLARTSNATIATNGADRATLDRWGATSALIPVGSSISAASDRDATAVRARYGIAPDALLLTTFGLLNHSKGFDTLAAALAQLRAGGTMAHLLLVGAGAGASDPTNLATEAALRAQCAAWGVTALVTRTGVLPAADVARALAASDVCLLPYRDGVSPRRTSLLAALAQGVPVVTTEPHAGVYDGLPALADGDAALLVPPDDAGALAAAVRRIIGDATLAARLRDGARAYAARFAWSEIARRHLAVYEGQAMSVTSRQQPIPTQWEAGR